MNRTWVRQEGRITYIGLTQEALNALGDIINIVPQYTAVHKDKSALCVESTRKLITIRSPITGSIIAVNHDLLARPNLITDKDWIYAVNSGPNNAV